MTNDVILVDVDNNELGTMDKLEAHRLGVLHRAFSIIIYNDKGEMLIQKRATSKYHSGGLWSNACCSHPIANHSMDQCIHTRIYQELGINVTDIDPLYNFIYKVTLDNGLIEHELDFVYSAKYNDEIVINTDEIEAWKYVDITTLKQDIQHQPHLFTEWFKMIVSRLHP